MSNCSLCKQEIQEFFLGKLKGTILKKPGFSKHYPVCFACQKKFQSKEEMLKALG